VIWLEAARDAYDLAPRITSRFGLSANVIGENPQDARIRIESEHGHRFIAELAEAFPGEIQSISVSKPTLEDVFIHRTGHRFWTEEKP